jgi:hypothetical protein
MPEASAILSILSSIGGRNFTLQLVSTLRQAIVQPYETGVEITGHMPLRYDGRACKKMAFCRIRYVADWHIHMPSVLVEEPWINYHADWHIYDNRSLCYELDARWRDMLAHVWRTTDENNTAHIAAQWLLESVGLLLGRHYHASITGITKWPREWVYWKHGDGGVCQYRHIKSLSNHE